jgi:hypothetical protein
MMCSFRSIRVASFVAAISFLSPLFEPLWARSRENNYLVPVNADREAREPEASYKKAVEEKLFLTPGEIARVVRLPGTVGVETVIAVYRQQPPKQAGYWVTVTQPSRSLWDPENRNGETNTKATTILRLDAPLPVTTALAIQKVWRAMLLGVREQPKSDEILLESSVQIFSAVNQDGKHLRGQLEGLGEGDTAALSDLANLLAAYCDSPASQRPHRARTIEEKATILLKRLASSNVGKR